ncbi:MAG: hypothetical protein RL387_880 [Bacteroidota bacterium]|jgi:hypothetical protein
MVLTELQYFGTISYIKSLFNAKEICFDPNETFAKMSFKNRTIIASAQGALNLSIPIIGGRDQKNSISTIQIDYSTPWQMHHIKSIQTCYKRAPFFDYYEESLLAIINTPVPNLAAYLFLLNEWVQKQLKNNWTIHPFIPGDNQDIYRDPWMPKNFQQINNPIKYHQVFEDQIGFIPNLSILDLLFCCGGKQAQILLKSS